MKKKAFTLIELLVVIAIIAILAAILFPVFTQAKNAAKKTQSISNLKQIALSSLMYSTEYDEVLPMSAYMKTPVAPDPRPVIFSIYDAVQPYMKNVQLFVSSSDAEGSKGQDWKARLNGINLTNVPGGVQYASYAPNLGLFGENFCGTPLARYSRVWSQSALPDVVSTIMFFDAYIKHFASPLDLTYNNFMGMARHSEGLVINFADGHAKFKKYNAIITEELTPASSTRPGILYYSWRPGPLLDTMADLEAVANTPADPYNDFHGVPGTNVGDSEDLGPC